MDVVNVHDPEAGDYYKALMSQLNLWRNFRQRQEQEESLKEQRQENIDDSNSNIREERVSRTLLQFLSISNTA